MNYDMTSSHNSHHKAISPEQLNEIVEAIADGRYSWACVLILRFVSYNPLHFIPQRTYSRLIKENSQVQSASLSTNRHTTSMPSSVNNTGNRTSSKILSKTNDRDYLETFDKKPGHVQGGNQAIRFR